MALELLAWDKARATGRLGDPGQDAAAGVIERGADCYRSLIRSLHGDASSYAPEQGVAWLSESMVERQGRQYMTTKVGLLGRDRLLLNEEDYERMDRVNPERSFSAEVVPGGPGATVVDELGRLASLFDAGALTTEEFEAAKARVLGLR